ncbi:hypothetical protein BZG36_00878 [Bifiguratus adelaidae]|uniref:PAN2-PAN3 deadenylation complex catalytic subunit PAN2 n=1 Tax=Bifiguratus adelaidae TaxID=1938954 RepID=A0A261Y5D6_9FUNG|nr:hypothetical protein BZG36_00878 [Bifiguratus adelaidae]
MDSWNEVRRFCITDPSKPVGISAVKADTYHDLIWIADERGYVRSHVWPGLERYTAFRVGSAEPVRQIMVLDRGVIFLAESRVQMRSRRGLVLWSVEAQGNKKFYCMTSSFLPNSEILVGGLNGVIVINTIRGIVTKEQSDTQNVVIIRKASRTIICGDMNGEIVMLNQRTLQVEQRIFAHTGSLSDLDIAGDLLLTCGFSQRQGTMVIDPMVKVYDIRGAIRSLPPIPFPSGPVTFAQHPNLSTTIFIASQLGQFQLCDINAVIGMSNSGAGQHFYQTQTSAFLTVMDVSSSGELLIICDASGMVMLWSDRETPSLNPYSAPIELPDPPQPPPNVIVDDDTPLSAIGMPYYVEKLLSVWPPNMVFEVGQPPEELNPDILAKMKTVDFVGYAPYTSSKKRNQVSRTGKQVKKGLEVPKFRSEQARELLRGGNGGAVDDSGDMPEDMPEDDEDAIDHSQEDMPKWYRRVEIQYSRFGVEDFDFGFYNRTKFGGLETHIAHSYCNSLLQALHFTLPLRAIAKHHISTSCNKENCLCCELGFLFRMLEDCKGQNCQASNFLRAFSTIPQAGALGLFEPEVPDPTISYSLLIQHFNRFILEQLHQDSNNSTSNPKLLKDDAYMELASNTVPSPIQQVFGMRTANVSKCSRCGNLNERIVYPFVVDMTYPKLDSIPPKLGSSDKKRSFADVLGLSLHRESQTKAWCSKCQAYQPTTTKKVVQSLPLVLNINTNAQTPEQQSYWQGNIGGDTHDWLPKKILVRIVGDRIEVEELRQGEDANDTLGRSSTEEASAIYELTSSVIQVQQGKEVPHLVAQIRIPDQELESRDRSPWYIFNDFLVRRINEGEVTAINKPWKVPGVLYYTRCDASKIWNDEVLNTKLDPSILLDDISISKNMDPTAQVHEVLSPDELPKKGTLVAIDAEFVAMNQEETEYRSDGTKHLIRPSRLSLARVSVLRGDGEKEGVPFIDDYIATGEPVEDYLTEFSGIVAGDLDPNASKHTLVPLKVAYKKLRLLLDMGCIFVGHGLKKDFRIINIFVPPEQVIDTVDIYHIRNRQRKISLRFLAWYLLKEDIQKDTHDSIEDAATALAIYKKYQQFRMEGKFGQVLEDIYDAGRKANWLKNQ